MRYFRPFLSLALAVLPACAVAADQAIPAAVRLALESVSERSLQGNLTFLASDLLEGRDTPSRGQDIAAEYIAAQFRKAGLEPAVQGSYFQTAAFTQAEPDLAGFQMTVKLASGETVSVPVAEVTVQAGSAIDATDAPVLHVASAEAATKLKADDVKGHVVAIQLQRDSTNLRSFNQLLRTLQGLKPAALLVIDQSNGPRVPMRSTV